MEDKDCIDQKEVLNNENTPNDHPELSSIKKHIPNLKFRSYRPYNIHLKTLYTEPVDVLDDLQWVNEELRTIVEDCKKSDNSLSNILPKSIDWDLERDISFKMDILKIRTQRSIAQLARKNVG